MGSKQLCFIEIQKRCAEVVIDTHRMCTTENVLQNSVFNGFNLN